MFILTFLIVPCLSRIGKTPPDLCLYPSEIEILEGIYESSNFTNHSLPSIAYTNVHPDIDIYIEVVELVLYPNITNNTEDTQKNESFITWIMLDENQTYTYCERMPSRYTPTIDRHGDPTDCKKWSIDLELTESILVCLGFIFEFGTVEWILAVYCIITTIGVLVFMNPKRLRCWCLVNKCKLSCNRSDYDAVSLVTYDKILIDFGMYEHINEIKIFSVL